jgi:hypothetical protein
MTPKQLICKWTKRIIIFCIIKSERFKRFYYAMQRAWYGFSNEDVFSVAYWLSDILPPAIDELIANKQGCPNDFLECAGDYATEEEIEAGIKRWEAVMIQIRDGFTAWANIENYGWHMLAEERKACIKKFRKGMVLMARYYHTMWW